MNVGNIFGVEDNRLVMKWENIIREILSRVYRVKIFKSYSDFFFFSKFKSFDDVFDFDDEVMFEFDSEGDEEEEVYFVDEEFGFYEVRDEIVCGFGILKGNLVILNDGEIVYLDIFGKKDLKK